MLQQIRGDLPPIIPQSLRLASPGLIDDCQLMRFDF
jgi:hypothetical protein